MQIKSKKLGKTVTFSRPGSCYIYVDLNGQHGTLGNQICHGGKLSGSTIGIDEKSDPDFKIMERICRKWYRQYIKNESADTND